MQTCGQCHAALLSNHFTHPGKEEFSDTLRKVIKEKYPDVPVICWGNTKKGGDLGKHYHATLVRHQTHQRRHLHACKRQRMSDPPLPLQSPQPTSPTPLFPNKHTHPLTRTSPLVPHMPPTRPPHPPPAPYPPKHLPPTPHTTTHPPTPHGWGKDGGDVNTLVDMLKQVQAGQLKADYGAKAAESSRKSLDRRNSLDRWGQLKRRGGGNSLDRWGQLKRRGGATAWTGGGS